MVGSSYISPDLHSISFAGSEDKRIPFIGTKVARGMGAVLGVNRCIMI